MFLKLQKYVQRKGVANIGSIQPRIKLWCTNFRDSQEESLIIRLDSDQDHHSMHTLRSNR